MNPYQINMELGKDLVKRRSVSPKKKKIVPRTHQSRPRPVVRFTPMRYLPKPSVVRVPHNAYIRHHAPGFGSPLTSAKSTPTKNGTGISLNSPPRGILGSRDAVDPAEIKEGKGAENMASSPFRPLARSHMYKALSTTSYASMSTSWDWRRHHRRFMRTQTLEIPVPPTLVPCILPSKDDEDCSLDASDSKTEGKEGKDKDADQDLDEKAQEVDEITAGGATKGDAEDKKCNGDDKPHVTSDESTVKLANSVAVATAHGHQANGKNGYLPSLEMDGRMETIPPFHELLQMSEEELANVQDFEVHSHFGKIRWYEPVDLRGLCISSVVQFKQGSISLYPSGKPEPGEGLNVHCIVMLFNCWPKSVMNGRMATEAKMASYSKRLEAFCEAHGLLFQKYENGFWEFEMDGETHEQQQQWNEEQEQTEW